MTDHTKYWGNNVVPKSEAQHAFGTIIRACPFCGSSHVALWVGPTFHVTCGGCGADGPAIFRQHEGDNAPRNAINLWNVRHAAYGPQGSG